MLLKEDVRKAANALQPKSCYFPQQERLKAQKDFNVVYAGKRLQGKCFILHYVSADNIIGRKVAVTVSKKVSRLAVARNKLKRRLREVYRCNKEILPDNIMLIIRSLPQAANADFHEIKSEIICLFTSVASKEHRYRANKIV